MSFGLSPSDVVNLGRAIKAAYDAWSSAPSDYGEVTARLDDFHCIVSKLEPTISEKAMPYVSARDMEDYQTILDGCQSTVSSLSNIAERYGRIGSGKKAHWDRIRLGSRAREISTLQQRLTAHMTAINAFVSTRNGEALGRMAEMQVECASRQKWQIDQTGQQLVLAANHTQVLEDVLLLVERMHDEQKQDRAAQEQPAKEESPVEGWQQLRADLLDMGFDWTLLKRHETHIKTFFMGLRYDELDRKGVAPFATEDLPFERSSKVFSIRTNETGLDGDGSRRPGLDAEIGSQATDATSGFSTRTPGETDEPVLTPDDSISVRNGEIKRDTLKPIRKERPSDLDGVNTAITFVNRTKAPISIVWIDWDGEPKHYSTVREGQSDRRPTFTGHVWRVTNTQTDEPIASFIARHGESSAVVEEGMAPVASPPAAFSLRSTARLWKAFSSRESRK